MTPLKRELPMTRRSPTRIPRQGFALGALALVLTSCALLVAATAGADTKRVENTNRVELVNVATGRRADVMWASAQDGQNVFLWRNNRSASQEFDLINMGLRPDGSGRSFFKIRARHSGKCLMVDRTQPKVSVGRRIAQYPCRTDASYRSAQWYFDPMNGRCDDNALCIDKGWRVIKNRYTGRCIDTANSSGRRPPEQAVLQLWTCIGSTDDWNANNQVWKIFDPATGQPVYFPR